MDETLEVRIRGPQAHIERRSGPLEDERETVFGESPLLDTPITSAAPPAAPLRGRLDDEEATELGASPALRPREARRPPASEPPLAARPRRNLETWGTDAAGFQAQHARVVRAEAQVPETRIPALKPLALALGVDALVTLEAVLAGRFDPRGVDAAPSPKRALERILFGRELGRLRLDDQAHLLQLLAASPRDSGLASTLARVLEATAIARWSDLERQRLAELFIHATPIVRARLADLAERRLRMRSALEDRDSTNAPAVETLAALAAPESAARGRRPGTSGWALEQALLSATAPQAIAGADIVSVLEFALAQGAPAELFRWAHGLATRGQVTLPGGGLIVDLPEPGGPPGGSGSRASLLRASLERLSQLVHPRPGAPRAPFTMPGGHGLDADVLARALGAIFGCGYTVVAGASAIARQLDRVSGEADRWPPVFVSALDAHAEHLFVLEGVAPDRIVVRAPRGGSARGAGAGGEGGERTVVDDSRGAGAFERGRFLALAGVALLPRVDLTVD